MDRYLFFAARQGLLLVHRSLNLHDGKLTLLSLIFVDVHLISFSFFPLFFV